MHRITRVAVFFCVCIALAGCASDAVVRLMQTETPRPTSTLVPTLPATETPPPATVLPPAAIGSVENPLRLRIIQSDLSSSPELQSILAQAARQAGIAISVDIHSADGAYALAQSGDAATQVDGWIGTDYDVAQLQQITTLATDVVTPNNQAFPFVRESIAHHPQYAVYPFAGKNYLVGIANAELLTELPLTTLDLMSIDRRTLGRTRYDMAFAWAEGRWFDSLVSLLDPSAIQQNSTRPPSPEALQLALSSLKELRTLGPREATSYQESVTDFANWRVQFTLDGDAGIRRYALYSETLDLLYAAPPIYSVTGTPINPPIDVVSLIVAQSGVPSEAAVLARLTTALQSGTIQTLLISRLHWVPMKPEYYSQIDINAHPNASIIANLAPSYQAQVYDTATICRWDAYEAVLPFVLLREQTVDTGVTSITTALEACRRP
jgi:hypothetical protein